MQIVFTLPMRNSHLSKRQCGRAFESANIVFFGQLRRLLLARTRRIGPLTNGWSPPPRSDQDPGYSVGTCPNRRRIWLAPNFPISKSLVRWLAIAPAEPKDFQRPRAHSI